ncbi:hypothetical protein ACJMK2_029553 [Sinanodonta woodiana]|uniref:Uncharacterized protein n=1 Tax=Sinanodonta woodiana TaxID=1069815 RepID=A0ABD3XED0_SINWO
MVSVIYVARIRNGDIDGESKKAAKRETYIYTVVEQSNTEMQVFSLERESILHEVVDCVRQTRLKYFGAMEYKTSLEKIHIWRESNIYKHKLSKNL